MKDESCSLQIQRIKRALYLRMNGVVADQMEQKGLHYRINYGVGQLHLKQIAATIEPDPLLAQALWKEQIRETMILATMLMPTKDFQWQECEIWISEMPTIELSGYFSMNLLSIHPLAIEWLPAILQAATPYSTHIVMHSLQRLFRHTPAFERDKLFDILAIVTLHIAGSDDIKRVNQWLLLHYDLIDARWLSPTRIEWIETISPVGTLFLEAKEALRIDFDLSLVEHPIKKS